MRFKRVFIRYIVNHFFCFTRFWGIKRVLLRWAGLQIGDNVKICGPFYFSNVSQIKIGNNTWIGENFRIDGNGSLTIGKNVDIAPHVLINTGGHMIGSPEHRAGQGLINNVVIGDGTWICTRVTIINQTCIGNGCVVAAGAVVIDDIGDNILVAGVPAKAKKTYDKHMISSTDNT